MTTSKTIVVHCDGGDLEPGTEWPQGFRRCERAFFSDGPQSPAEVRKEARKAGWACKNGWDHCPKHIDQAH